MYGHKKAILQQTGRLYSKEEERKMKRAIVVMLAATLLLAMGSGMASAITVTLNADTATNASGSPLWAAYRTAAFADVAAGTFVDMRSGTYVGRSMFEATEAIVYSTGDLGKRLHWFYWLPGQTVAGMNGLFQVKDVTDWDGVDWTYDWGTGTQVEDGPEVGWIQPGSWINYNGGVIGTFGNAYWAWDDAALPYDTGGNAYNETDAADIQALAGMMYASQTHWTGVVRFRESVNDPWVVQSMRVDMVPSPAVWPCSRPV